MSTTPEEDAIRNAAQVRDVIEIAIPGNLNRNTQCLVEGFAVALAEKLFAAEMKYGYSNGWQTGEWIKSGECVRRMLKHVAKGDPRDVAAYCAFLWYHGASTKTDASESLNLAAAECASLTTMPGHYEPQFQSILAAHALVEESQRLLMEPHNATVIDLQGNRHRCTLALGLAVQGLREELDDVKAKLESAKTELANSVSAETFRAGRRDFDHIKGKYEKLLARLAPGDGNDSPTPETDAAADRAANFFEESDCVLATLARALERQRDEARRELKKYIEDSEFVPVEIYEALNRELATLRSKSSTP